jgi:hypothetical protein
MRWVVETNLKECRARNAVTHESGAMMQGTLHQRVQCSTVGGKNTLPPLTQLITFFPSLEIIILLVVISFVYGCCDPLDPAVSHSFVE